MDTNQYMEMFLEESREHLQSLNDGLLALENDPEEVSVVNDIFRNAHTIKGMSATMGFTKIAELTHDMENVFDLLRKEQMKVNPDIMDTLFKTIDSLEQMTWLISRASLRSSARWQAANPFRKPSLRRLLRLRLLLRRLRLRRPGRPSNTRIRTKTSF